MTAHTLEIWPVYGAIGASCSCGEWKVGVMQDGIDYRPEWKAHLAQVSETKENS